ncbi:MAG: F0F1 ATP synthase subunit gamma, partial [Chloroflexi bacterium]|nr:F0F1 ATP synthase subunit gamma [Chloroflexota bacterium]
MPTIRELRRRIRDVENVSRVTKAMQTIAASKMRRAQRQVV